MRRRRLHAERCEPARHGANLPGIGRRRRERGDPRRLRGHPRQRGGGGGLRQGRDGPESDELVLGALLDGPGPLIPDLHQVRLRPQRRLLLEAHRPFGADPSSRGLEGVRTLLTAGGSLGGAGPWWICPLRRRARDDAGRRELGYGPHLPEVALARRVQGVGRGQLPPAPAPQRLVEEARAWPIPDALIGCRPLATWHARLLSGVALLVSPSSVGATLCHPAVGSRSAVLLPALACRAPGSSAPSPPGAELRQFRLRLRERRRCLLQFLRLGRKRLPCSSQLLVDGGKLVLELLVLTLGAGELHLHELQLLHQLLMGLGVDAVGVAARVVATPSASPAVLARLAPPMLAPLAASVIIAVAAAFRSAHLLLRVLF
mmetsp:Transcript_1980/g.5776  ORF Transcript_1980/g.5776 Transcript_1980/m.5776 type:complete len:374 (-) Transcript_1980:856-1977(-)